MAAARKIARLPEKNYIARLWWAAAPHQLIRLWSNQSAWAYIALQQKLVVQVVTLLFLYYYYYTRLTTLCPGLPGWASTRKVKPIWILLEQETVSGSDISWAICKSAPRSRQITMLAPHHSVFTGRMPFLPPNQQRQSTEGLILLNYYFILLLFKKLIYTR